jgi:DNA-binding CsgD family transcriptional regulator
MGAGRVERLIVPVARRRARRAVHRWDDASTDSGSGWRSPAGPPAVSPAVGTRWFREGGGMPNVSRAPLSGRSLSFAEREEIAILGAQAVGVRETARRLGRSPSTISRELRRNAATRGGRLQYQATTAR